MALHQGAAQAAAVFDDGLDHLAESQHAHQIALRHHDERAHIALGHEADGFVQGFIRPGGEQGAAFEAQDIADFHGVSLGPWTARVGNSGESCIQYSPQ